MTLKTVVKNMRTIKFRGKSIANGEWAFGDLHTLCDKPHIHTERTSFPYAGKRVFVDPETIGQFTGLHDKNGKEIYEGDILVYWMEDTRCVNPDCEPFNWIYEPIIRKVKDVVSYEDGMFTCEDYAPLTWCGIVNLDELRNDLNVTEEYGWSDSDGNIIDESILGIEVIGNIHDNPNLIE